MNYKKPAISSWRADLVIYMRSELWHAAVGFGLGEFVGAFLYFWRNNTITVTKWLISALPVRTSHAVFTLWTPQIWFILGPIAALLLFLLVEAVWRGVKSWAYGVTSGSFLLPMLIAAISSFSFSPKNVAIEVASVVLAFVALLVGFALRFSGAVRNKRTPTPKPYRSYGPKPISLSRDPAAPIEFLQEDRLGRSAFVETLAARILSSKSPVIALRGDFGDGKSSTLNLLKEEIGHAAIVLPFNSWLPDSPKALAADLLDDLAIEIRRRFLVPGLRKRLRKFAYLLAEGMPYLKGIPIVVRPYTQRNEINDLAALLSRIPKRTVILVDELDRMQREELLMLLKVIRGTTSLPNITFVCAFEEKQLQKTVCGTYGQESHEFMEKFFPTGVDLPKLNSDLLWRELRQQLLNTFQDAGWFSADKDLDDFLNSFEELHKKALFQVFTNLRKIGLLINDVYVAATLTNGEVNALDLCTLEILRIFYPRIYNIIWVNAPYFSSSTNWWKSISFVPPQVAEADRQRISAEVKTVSLETDDPHVVETLLAYLFPERAKELAGEKLRGSEGQYSFERIESQKRISHPDFFPIYFCRTVPETKFSSFAMNDLKARLMAAESDLERREIFSKTLNSLDQSSLRRYDFVHQIKQELSGFSMNVACSVGLSIASNAAQFGEGFTNEAIKAVECVLAAAKTLATPDQISSFISECIASAQSNLFAARLYTLATAKDGKDGSGTFDKIDRLKLEQAFKKRMNDRFGNAADVTDLKLNRLDINAFFVWANISETERSYEISFWQRYIGTSRRLLGDAFELIAPADEFWTNETPQYIDKMIPKSFLRKMFEKTDDTESLSESQIRSLRQLEKFLVAD